MFPRHFARHAPYVLRSTWGSLTILDVAVVGLLLFTLARAGTNVTPEPLTTDAERTGRTAAAGRLADLQLPVAPRVTAYVTRSEAEAAYVQRLFASRETPYVAGAPTGGFRTVVVAGPGDEAALANLARAGVRLQLFEPLAAD